MLSNETLAATTRVEPGEQISHGQKNIVDGASMVIYGRMIEIIP